MSNYTKKALKGAFIFVVFSGLTAILTYIIRIILARSFSMAEFGLIYSVISLFGLVSILHHFGFIESLTKHISEFTSVGNYKAIKLSIIFSFIVQMIGSLIIFVTFVTLSSFLARDYFKMPEARMLVIIYAFVILFAVFENVFISIFQGFQRYYLFSLTQFIRYIIILLLMIIFMHYGLGIYSYFMAYAFGVLMPCFVYYFIFIKYVFPDFFHLKMNIDKKIIKKITSFAFYVVLASSAGVLLTYLDTIMITYYRSLEEVGLYNAAVPVASILLILSSFLMPIVLPLSSELWAKKKITELKEGILLLNKFFPIVLLPILVIFIVFADDIIVLFFGPDYVSATNCMIILSIGMIFTSMNVINRSVLSGIGKPEENTKIMFFGLIINVIGNLIMIPKYGFIGASIATLLSTTIMYVISCIVTNKFIDVKIPYLAWGKTLVASGAFAAVVMYVSFMIKIAIIGPIISLIAGSTLYVIILLLVKVITIDEIMMIYKRVAG